MAQTSVNSVSPASAFWGLSAIALNTMSQPSGRVLGLPSKHSFALRTSPVVCGLSMIDTVLEFCYDLFRTSSPRKAATDIVRFRLADLDNSVKDDFAVLRSNTIFRAITFFLGALPQAVKIYTMKGSQWTQILATIYLATFLLDELVFVMAVKEGVELSNDLAHQLPNRYWISCAKIALAFSVLLPQILVSASLYTLIQYCSYQTAILVLSVAVIVFALHLGGTWGSNGMALALFSIPFLVLGNLSGNATSMGLMLLRAKSEDRVKFLHDTTVIAVAVSVTVKVVASVWTFNKVLNNIVPRYESWTQFQLSAYYLVLHIGAAILGYAFLYDSKTTSKPRWTDLLG